MPFDGLKRTVIDADLCARCGACVAVCPEQILAVEELLPVLREPGADARCGACTDCEDVCPGLDPGTDQLETTLFGRPRTVDERWLGIYTSLMGAHASDGRTFSRAGAGGSVSTVLAEAMRVLELDWVLVCGREDD